MVTGRADAQRRKHPQQRPHRMTLSVARKIWTYNDGGATEARPQCMLRCAGVVEKRAGRVVRWALWLVRRWARRLDDLLDTSGSLRET